MEFIKTVSEILLYTYFFTFCVAPAVIGYLMGRYANFLTRIPLAAWIIVAGYPMVKFSRHGFHEVYIPGTILYIALCVLGLLHKSRRKKIKFVSMHHSDWITVTLSTIIYLTVYQRPLV